MRRTGSIGLLGLWGRGFEEGLRAAQAIVEEDPAHAHQRIDQLRGIATAAGLA
jgi:hypothetical protein